MTPKDFRVTPDLHASKGQRFLNVIIDRFLFTGFIYALMILVAFLVYNFTTNTLWLDEFFIELEGLSRIMDHVYTGIIFTIFYSLSEILLKGRTIGKYITKTMVVMEDGSKAKPADIVIRSLCRLIPFNGFSFLGDDARGWHDRRNRKD